LSFAVGGTVTEVDVKAGDTVRVGQVLARVDPGDAQAALDAAQARVADAADAVDRAQQTADLPVCPTATAPAPHPSGSGPGGGRTPGSSHAPTIGAPAAPAPGVATQALRVQAVPVQALPVQAVPAQALPVQAAPVQAVLVQAVLVQAVPVQAVRAVAVEAVPVQAAAPSAPTCVQPGRASTNDQLLSAQQQLNNANLALLQARTRLAGTVITAPLAGRVLSVAGKVGGSAAPGGTGFVVLGDVSSLAVTAQFSEADIGRISVGQTASITLPGRTAAVAGTVSQVDPAGTTSGRLVRYGVLVAFDEIPADLLLGQSATVSVTTASADNVLYASSAAVTGVVDGRGTVTVRVNGRDETRPVTVGLRGDRYTELRSGVAAGDVLVLPGAGG
jgi:multidrug resistance efflux pump